MSRPLPASGAAGVLVCAAFAVVGLVCGCERYEKDVGGRPFLSGLEGADVPEVASGRPEGYRDLVTSGVETRTEDEDGTVTLRALTGRQLMRHIFETLRDEEKDLFIEQVLSEATKAEFAAHGQTPEDAYNMLRESLSDIDRLFSRMPMGETTPNTQVVPLGQGLQRIRLVRGVGRDLRWQGFDMVMEDGNQRLLWFYTERR